MGGNNGEKTQMIALVYHIALKCFGWLITCYSSNGTYVSRNSALAADWATLPISSNVIFHQISQEPHQVLRTLKRNICTYTFNIILIYIYIQYIIYINIISYNIYIYTIINICIYTVRQLTHTHTHNSAPACSRKLASQLFMPCFTKYNLLNSSFLKQARISVAHLSPLRPDHLHFLLGRFHRRRKRNRVCHKRSQGWV